MASSNINSSDGYHDMRISPDPTTLSNNLYRMNMYEENSIHVNNHTSTYVNSTQIQTSITLSSEIVDNTYEDIDENTSPRDQDEMLVDHDQNFPYDDQNHETTVNEQIGLPPTVVAPTNNAAIIERRQFRPSYKLSIKLIDTYKNINKIYYENKAKRLKESQTLEAASGTSSSSTNQGRFGVNNDGYDDSNFNYILREGPEGELFDNRYIFKHKIGSGSFGQVICAYDKMKREDVAIKVIKSKRPFLIQAQTEIELLNLVTRKQDDEELDYNCITLLDTFVHHNHQCLVFEMLSYNLYDLLRNSKFRGVSFGLVRKFGRQILQALEFLSRPDVDIIHCDLKPENILLRNPKRSAIKIIDFGSSCKRSVRPYTYIQSRFYRSPEVLLCLGYDQKIDIWSLGCVLVEMHTGEPLFGGKDQLDQLFRIITMFGMLPIHMIENCSQQTRSVFFEKVLVSTRPNFLPEFPSDCDPSKRILSSDKTAYFVLKKPKSFNSLPTTRTLEEVLGVRTGGPGGRRFGEAGHDVDNYLEFIDLIRHLLQYDSTERFSAVEALTHPFFTPQAQPTIAPPAAPSSGTASGTGSPRYHHQVGTVLGTDITEDVVTATAYTSSDYSITNQARNMDIELNNSNSHNDNSYDTNLEASGQDKDSSIDINDSSIIGKRRMSLNDSNQRIRSRSAPSSASSSHNMRLRSSQEES